MSIFVPNTDNYITATMTTLLGAAPGYTYLTQFRDFVTQAGGGTDGLYAYANALTNYTLTFEADNSIETLASSIVANIGITDEEAAATAAANIQDLLESADGNYGPAMIQLINIIVDLQSDATWGAASTLFINKVNAGYVYSVNPANTSTDLTVLQAAVAVDDDGNVVTPGQTFTLTTGTDFANQSVSFINNSIPTSFVFTSANELIESTSGSMTTADTLLDGSTTDNDVINIRGALATNNQMGTLQNIETINFIGSSSAAQTMNMATVTGAEALNISGTFAGASTVSNVGKTGITSFDFSGITTTGANGGVTVTQGTTAATSDLTMKGGAGQDNLTGGDGNDTISGNGDADILSGGKGNDTLDGGAGNDTLTGGDGNDTFQITLGTDAVTDLATGDTFVVSSGATMNATVTGGAFVATASDANNAAGAANASLTVGVGGAVTSGKIDMSLATGAFTLAGSTGGDTLIGGAGNDVIGGGAGNDSISGNAGDDVITGGAGADVLTGGTGADTFTFAVAQSVASTAQVFAGANVAANDTITFGNGVDYISDFAVTVDKLDVTTAAAAPTTLIGVATGAALTAGTSYVAYGTWNAATGTFTVAAAYNAATAQDAMVVVDGNGQTAIATTGVVILDNLTAALVAGDII